MTSPTPPPEAPEAKPAISAKEAYDIFASQLNKEDALIASRMTWGLTSNGAALSVFGGLYAFVNSTYADISPASKALVLIVALVILFTLSFDVYYHSVEAIGDARRQIYHIRQIYHQHWGQKLEALNLPRPYGSRLPHGQHDYKEPEFFAFPNIVLRKWLPFAAQLHGKKWGRYELVHIPSYQGSSRERRWYAEKILFASMSTWGALLIILLVGLLSEHLTGNTGPKHASALPTSSGPCRSNQR